MKPKQRSKYAAAITLSKGKMYEYGVPEDHHLELPKDLDLEMQFPLAIGTIGDFASETVEKAIGTNTHTKTSNDEIIFAAQVLQAYDDSHLNDELSFNLRLLAAVGFYLGDVPGNAAVQISKLQSILDYGNDPLAHAAMVAMDKPWIQTLSFNTTPYAEAILNSIGSHFREGNAVDAAIQAIRILRNWAYENASAHDLLMADLLGAITFTRIARSAWTLLPQYSELDPIVWKPYLSRPMSLKEMWPSQRMLGNAGLYKGQSGIVQMPTSAGKSRATELIIRSAFLSKRTKLALVIAPFRALCQEIANDLQRAFNDDDYDVNQLSDALQPDIDMEIFNVKIEGRSQVVVLTPEKLLYTLRQEPKIVQQAGLVVYDEGHQFDTGKRGVTYELLLTSIKRLLPGSAQSVLISAVIQNANAVASWLLKDKSRVISSRSLQATRLVAFASLPKGKEGQLQFNVASDSEQAFFVPRVITQEKQPRLPKEKVDRFFPTEESGSIALYLALRLIGNGGVAIYAGKKASAAKIVRDAVEDTFRRGTSLAPPSEYSDADEIRRFTYLYESNFGPSAYLTGAAKLGIFAHHGNTPQGVRLAIEHAMRNRLIRLIVCTSTLAQGVNLPIRYLLVTSPMQGRESIKARDFHNLMGRAGRAGMYGEGTIIFTDHRLFDGRAIEPRRWENSVKLINPDSAEPTGSTLLSLLNPMANDTGTFTLGSPSPYEIATRIVDDWDGIYEAVGNLSIELQKAKFSVKSLREQLKEKKMIVEAIESFLMTYRSDVDSETFVANSRELAGETLAHSLASPEQQSLLANVFESVARRIERLVPETTDQHRFGRTLLGIDHALAIETWVQNNLQKIGEVDSSENLLDLLWPLLSTLSTEKRLTDTTPADALKSLATEWVKGHSFSTLLKEMKEIGATYPYGRNKRQFDIDLVVEICEQTFGFEFALLLASVKESFVKLSDENLHENFKNHSDLLQKRLKYGLPDQKCIAYFEAGYAERVAAQAFSNATQQEIVRTTRDVRSLTRKYPHIFEAILRDFPSYFTDVFRAIKGT